MLETASRIRTAVGFPLAALAFFALAAPVLAGGDWNDAGVAWKPYEQGLAEAKSANKPVCGSRFARCHRMRPFAGSTTIKC